MEPKRSLFILVLEKRGVMIAQAGVWGVLCILFKGRGFSRLYPLGSVGHDVMRAGKGANAGQRMGKETSREASS